MGQIYNLKRLGRGKRKKKSPKKFSADHRGWHMGTTRVDTWIILEGTGVGISRIE